MKKFVTSLLVAAFMPAGALAATQLTHYLSHTHGSQYSDEITLLQQVLLASIPTGPDTASDNPERTTLTAAEKVSIKSGLGSFGRLTQEAVRVFQRADLAKGTGSLIRQVEDCSDPDSLPDSAIISGSVGACTRQVINDMLANGTINLDTVSQDSASLVFPAGGETFQLNEGTRIKWYPPKNFSDFPGAVFILKNSVTNESFVVAQVQPSEIESADLQSKPWDLSPSAMGGAIPAGQYKLSLCEPPGSGAVPDPTNVVNCTSTSADFNITLAPSAVPVITLVSKSPATAQIGSSDAVVTTQQLPTTGTWQWGLYTTDGTYVASDSGSYEDNSSAGKSALAHLFSKTYYQGVTLQPGSYVLKICSTSGALCSNSIPVTLTVATSDRTYISNPLLSAASSGASGLSALIPETTTLKPGATMRVGWVDNNPLFPGRTYQIQLNKDGVPFATLASGITGTNWAPNEAYAYHLYADVNIPANLSRGNYYIVVDITPALANSNLIETGYNKTSNLTVANPVVPAINPPPDYVSPANFNGKMVQPGTSLSVLTSNGATIQGATRQLTVSGADGLSVTWSSSNAQIASVDANGLVTGVAPGRAMITASVAGAAPAGLLFKVGNACSTGWTGDFDEVGLSNGDQRFVCANDAGGNGVWYQSYGPDSFATLAPACTQKGSWYLLTAGGAWNRGAMPACSNQAGGQINPVFTIVPPAPASKLTTDATMQDIKVTVTRTDTGSVPVNFAAISSNLIVNVTPSSCTSSCTLTLSVPSPVGSANAKVLSLSGTYPITLSSTYTLTDGTIASGDQKTFNIVVNAPAQTPTYTFTATVQDVSEGGTLNVTQNSGVLSKVVVLTLTGNTGSTVSLLAGQTSSANVTYCGGATPITMAPVQLNSTPVLAQLQINTACLDIVPYAITLTFQSDQGISQTLHFTLNVSSTAGVSVQKFPSNDDYTASSGSCAGINGGWWDYQNYGITYQGGPQDPRILCYNNGKDLNKNAMPGTGYYYSPTGDWGGNAYKVGTCVQKGPADTGYHSSVDGTRWILGDKKTDSACLAAAKKTTLAPRSSELAAVLDALKTLLRSLQGGF